MLTYNHTFSSFSVDELPQAKKFYGEILGLNISEAGKMGLSIHLKDNHRFLSIPKLITNPLLSPY